MRSFIDVGAHEGQTLEEVVLHDFERIYAIEPMPAQFSTLLVRYGEDPRISFVEAALSHTNGRANIYGDNSHLEASLAPHKIDVDASFVTEVDCLRASDFMAKVPDGDILMKLNCEGAEVPILNDLLDTGQIHRLKRILIDWDIRKVPGLEHTEFRLRDRMAAEGFVRYDDWPEGDTHRDRVRQWIEGVERAVTSLQ